MATNVLEIDKKAKERLRGHQEDRERRLGTLSSISGIAVAPSSAISLTLHAHRRLGFCYKFSLQHSRFDLRFCFSPSLASANEEQHVNQNV